MRTIIAAVLTSLIIVSKSNACPLPGLDRSTASQLPADGEIAKRFGSAYNGLLNKFEVHTGIDIEGATGLPVRSVAGGIVAFGGTNGSLGSTVEVLHGGSVVTVYGHLSRLTVSEGECVQAGTQIGEIGCTGLCAKSHLHFEVRKHSEAIDPAILLQLPAIEPIDPSTAWITVNRGALLDAVIATVEANFLDKALLAQLSWKAKANALRPAILAVPTSADAVQLINELLGLLETSHTALFTPDDYEYYILRDPQFTGKVGVATFDPRIGKLAEQIPLFPGIGMFTTIVEGRHHIDGLLEGSPADKAGLKYGDEILAVDGAPYHPVSAFDGKAGQAVKLLVRRQVGAEPEIVEVPPSSTQLVASAALTAATLASAKVIERNGKQIGYVRLWGFHDDSLERALGLITQKLMDTESRGSHSGSQIPNGSTTEGIGNAGAVNPHSTRAAIYGGSKMIAKSSIDASTLDYLIVDVRGKVGGNGKVVRDNLALLDSPKKNFFPNYSFDQTAVWHSANRGSLQGKVEVKPSIETPVSFHSRSALLIDQHTRSAGEIFAYGWKRGGFGPVLGSKTQGAVVSGGTFLTPGGLLLYVARTGHQIDGHVLEGTGIEPDHVVEHPLPYAQGADPVLEAAIEKLAGPLTK